MRMHTELFFQKWQGLVSEAFQHTRTRQKRLAFFFEKLQSPFSCPHDGDTHAPWCPDRGRISLSPLVRLVSRHSRGRDQFSFAKFRIVLLFSSNLDLKLILYFGREKSSHAGRCMELAGPAIYHMGPYGRWASRPVLSLSLRFPTSLSVSLSALISLSLRRRRARARARAGSSSR
jgi:hypothetical protein